VSSKENIAVKRIDRLCFALFLLWGMLMPVSALAQVEIVVHVSTQTLSLRENGKTLASYPVSTARNGVGSRMGSNQTPLGRHKIAKKIGHGAPSLTIFKARVNTGQQAELNGDNSGDLVTTRILWLRGLEPGKNAGGKLDSFARYIYIHGTPEESKIGTPASHGCVRMKNDDVIELFERVAEGTLVTIVE
jgi:lipoprotein-anchoring transpeptidase ErfK/SrfK